MTESNTSKTEGHDKTPALLAKNKDGASPKNGQKAGGQELPAQNMSRPGLSLKAPFAVVVLLAVGLGGVAWQLYQSGQQAQLSIQQQLEQTNQVIADAAQTARKAQAQSAAQGTTLAKLQAQVNELQSQLGNLDQAFQVLTDSGSDLVLLNDIDHLVSIANQQIILGGNVANAIVALETAQARLSRANRPVLASVQQTLNGDLERLRAAAVVDVSALSAQLDQLSGLLAQAPLLVPDDAVPDIQGASSSATERATPSDPFTPNPDASWWRNAFDGTVHWIGDAWTMLRHDLAGFISVRRVDDRSALLISPDQAEQLRLTLKLRVMTAQLALMMRQADVWKAELDAISKALGSHFDAQSPTTQRALRIATRLIDTPVDARLPALTQTQSALEAVRQESTRAIEQRRGSSSVGSEPAADSAGDKATSTSPETPSSGSPVSAAMSAVSQG